MAHTAVAAAGRGCCRQLHSRDSTSGNQVQILTHLKWYDQNKELMFELQ